MSNQRRLALVTGANKGIGREVATRLGQLGMTVLVGARDPARGSAAIQALRAAGGDAQLVVLDVTNAASIAAAARRVGDDFGQLDVLVNNAAIARGGSTPSRQSLPAMREIYETNFFGAVAVTQAFLPLLRAAGAARIVNLSSSLGSLGLASDPATAVAQQAAYFGYASSKTALNAFTVRLAYELRDTAIKVNAACPGYVATDLNQQRGVRTVAQGAAIVIRLSTLPDEGPSGGFFDDAGSVVW